MLFCETHERPGGRVSARAATRPYRPLCLLKSNCSKIPNFGSDDFVYVADTAKGWLVKASEISTLEASGNYVEVRFGANGSKAMIRRPLAKCEERLDGRVFFRANRSYLVNLNYVSQVRPLDRRRVEFILSDGREVAVSSERTLLLRRSMSL